MCGRAGEQKTMHRTLCRLLFSSLPITIYPYQSLTKYMGIARDIMLLAYKKHHFQVDGKSVTQAEMTRNALDYFS